MSVNYTYKPNRKKEPTLLEKIQKAFREFIRSIKHGALTAAGLVATLMSLFAGSIFSAIVVGGMTYIFWKNSKGVDELVGKCKCQEV